MAALEVEIREIPPLPPKQAAQVDLHSVLNILNVLHGELTLLGIALEDAPDLFCEAHALCERMRDDLVEPAAALRHAQSIGETATRIRTIVSRGLDRHPHRRDDPGILESLANIDSVFRVFGVRAREILARAREPAAWLDIPVEALRADLQTFLAAIEKNGRGRFRIVQNAASQGPTDYCLHLAIESANHRSLLMPLVFKDVVRDLLANARKYTSPGGLLSLGLRDTGSGLALVVQDTGCGIPPDEIERVVLPGVRGSNVGDVRTMGAGFGLTKAFLVTKQFGGRLWIRSELGRGTRVRIEIPRPARAATADAAA
jgi:signal transduction histidine kinase